jgi:hypothetical protein
MRVLIVLLLCAAALVHADTVPEQIHTAFAGPNGLAISWFTLNATATSTVLYGLDSKLDQSSSGSARNYGMDGFHHVRRARGCFIRIPYSRAVKLISFARCIEFYSLVTARGHQESRGTHDVLLRRRRRCGRLQRHVLGVDGARARRPDGIHCRNSRCVSNECSASDCCC